MPKINYEEYEVLKGLDNKWKWIARDKDRGLYAFTEKPVRKYDPSPYWDTETGRPYTALELCDEIHLFQFIQWEDENPYNIAELIEEYEKYKKASDYFKVNIKNVNQSMLDDLPTESEETEVKNIEELKSWFEEDKYYEGEYVKHKIDQLDEPEITEEQAKDALEEKGYTIARMYDSDNETVLPYDFYRQVLLAHGYLIIEKPVIPQFVAGFIEDTKKQGKALVFAITHIYDENEIGKSPTEKENRIFQWMELADNDELLARAWLAYPNIEVEEEQKYYVLDTEDIPMLVRTHGVVNRANTHLGIHEKGRNTEHYQLTEQEIKDYDPRYMTFAKPVKELEE